jgi:hypothetical protein
MQFMYDCFFFKKGVFASIQVDYLSIYVQRLYRGLVSV